MMNHRAGEQRGVANHFQDSAGLLMKTGSRSARANRALRESRAKMGLRTSMVNVRKLYGMSQITSILSAIDGGDPSAVQQLLPLVYDELRKLAAHKLAQENPGQTLQATALVHEAYVRLVDTDQAQQWNGRRHFFAAAAEAMRRILVEKARHKQAAKHGGGMKRHAGQPDELPDKQASEPLEILAIHEALDGLAARSPRKAELVKLRYFLGCTMAEAAELLGIAPATAEEDWTFAKAWLRQHLDTDG